MTDIQQAIQTRRSNYSINNKTQMSDEEIIKRIQIAVKNCPSAFNSQSSRVVVLLNEEHKKFWQLTFAELQKHVSKDKISATENKINSFAAGKGTLLFFEEEETIERLEKQIKYLIVSEAGASVYSATDLAKKEFPDFDVNLRSAVSIARRLQDPLAELVKIPPESIGVGQYQHDMNQKRLKEVLGNVVEDCVNSVGVNLNSASVSLLNYVSGISPSIAKNIVAYRDEHGNFRNREELLSVKMLGQKAYEQYKNAKSDDRAYQNDKLKEILNSTPIQTEFNSELLEQTISKIMVQNQTGLEFHLKNGRTITIPTKEET